jgi:hypothetical protein
MAQPMLINLGLPKSSQPVQALWKCPSASWNCMK